MLQWQWYAGWLATMFPELWEEVKQMGRHKGKGPVLDVRPVIEKLGLKEVIEPVGVDRVLEAVGPKKLVETLGTDRLLAGLTLEQREELRRRLREEQPEEQT